MRGGETHFPTAHELVSYLDEAQRGKHIHEETAPWVFKGSVRKEAHDPTVHFLQTAHPRSEAVPLAWRVVLLTQTFSTALGTFKSWVLMTMISPSRGH